jgi:hypothetical protein
MDAVCCMQLKAFGHSRGSASVVWCVGEPSKWQAWSRHLVPFQVRDELSCDPQPVCPDEHREVVTTIVCNAGLRCSRHFGECMGVQVGVQKGRCRWLAKSIIRSIWHHACRSAMQGVPRCCTASMTGAVTSVIASGKVVTSVWRKACKCV